MHQEICKTLAQCFTWTILPGHRSSYEWRPLSRLYSFSLDSVIISINYISIHSSQTEYFLIIQEMPGLSLVLPLVELPVCSPSSMKESPTATAPWDMPARLGAPQELIKMEIISVVSGDTVHKLVSLAQPLTHWTSLLLLTIWRIIVLRLSWALSLSLPRLDQLKLLQLL